ncbi:MAG TPA: fibronectin type III domain-containing protein, partial [Solirubrobacteraceae bacterium]|nr:fibronectin type III domain-containing protein [Solirubrobacteraceae bacterium]
MDVFRAGELSRRELLRRAAWTGAGVAVGYGWRAGVARAASAPPAGLHLQYGADPTRSMAVSWRTPPGAGNPRLRVGRATAGFQLELVPQTRTIIDPDPTLGAALTYPVSEYQHGVVAGLEPNTAYVYEVSHDGADPVRGTFHTARAARTRMRFTAFGDQGTGTASDAESTPFGAYVVDQVESLEPAFHLHLGDLAYSNLHRGTDRGPAWDRFIDNNSRSAANRPWMPALGNHEIDGGTGPQGYGAYLTRFELPGNGNSKYAGHWYAFTAGSVRVIVTDANDACYQDGGVDLYIRDYSAGAQLA